MLKQLEITYQMTRPDETKEARITLPVTPKLADTLLGGGHNAIVDAVLYLLAEMQGYDAAAYCRCEDADGHTDVPGMKDLAVAGRTAGTGEDADGAIRLRVTPELAGAILSRESGAALDILLAALTRLQGRTEARIRAAAAA